MTQTPGGPERPATSAELAAQITAWLDLLTPDERREVVTRLAGV